MSDSLFYILSAILSMLVLLGIHWGSKVRTSVRGIRLSALAILLAIIIVFIKYNLLGIMDIWIGLAIGIAISVYITARVKMIGMPQLVGLLNGLGGLASAAAALLTIQHGGNITKFELMTALIGLAVGAFTLSGSLVAAGKLHRILPQKPIVLPRGQLLLGMIALLMMVLILIPMFASSNVVTYTWLLLAVSLLFGLLFALPVGGADMPITISLLNSTSGIAAAITGMAIGNVLLVSVGGIVGASGLLLTLIMCRSMNRKLSGVIFSRKRIDVHSLDASVSMPEDEKELTPLQSVNIMSESVPVAAQETDLADWLSDAKNIVIIPGYGMAVSQAQELVKTLLDKLEQGGCKVRFAIHPVAGRMPGHMNVLLAEVDIPYDKLFEMDEINPDMHNADIVIVIGANDVINPAANTAQGTPIYGMPVLDVQKAKKLVICNFDKKPGYAGVENPLYDNSPNIILLLGDAKDSLEKIIRHLG
ncbi:MAG: NAD(P)(+) transhydrogenase (Re/Si-specific) subunit beta [Clostridiales bacterium]|nr:NAD(P)(+) transhydrogenase (Re/Si-specific) subunit beta [Clostridiales bacterium]